MLKNYFKIAVRNLLRHKGYTLINISGLAVGMACCLLIVLFVQDELSYDRYHENANRIHRLRVERFASGGETELVARAAAPMAPAIINDYPQVERAVRISQRTYLVERGDQRFYEEKFLWADSTLFDVFSFMLVKGNPKTALAAPHSVVLTEELAKKYFGDEEPMGQLLTIEKREVKVTGIVQRPPAQSHFTFDLLGSFSTLEILNQRPSTQWGWWNLGYHTYLLLAPGAPAADLQAQLRELPSRYVGDEEKQSGYRQFLYLQPLTDIHLHSHYRGEIEPNSDIAYVYVFSAVALFILIIACINFMNLATARSAQRAKEVGMRKTAGAVKSQLVGQFLGESILLAIFAFVVALLLIEFFMPSFNQLANKALSPRYFEQIPFFAGAFLFAAIVGVVAGIYPAFALSAFQPVEVLKGKASSGAKGAFLRKGLVVFQFAISVALIVGSMVAFHQMRFMQSKNLGFQKEQMVVLNMRNNDEVRHRYEFFKTELGQIPAVIDAAFSSSVPGRGNNTNVISRKEGMNEEGQTMSILAVDYDFVQNYGLELVSGRTFSKNFATDTAAFVINEATVKALGWRTAEEAVGNKLTRQFSDTRQIIGVVKDFHFSSVQNAIEPLVLQIHPRWFNYVSVHIDAKDVSGALSQLREKYQALAPGRPFEYFFLDDDFDRQYRLEERVSQILNVFTAITIFVACLGLFGLASFMAEQRTKEIGIRKVLGATVSNVTLLLSKDFVKLVLAANLLAWPAAYFAMNKWLQAFAYRIDLGWWIFALAGGVALFIALLTVSTQAIKAALTNPVEALRYE